MSLFQTPYQISASSVVRPGCSWLDPAGAWIPPRTEMAQRLGAISVTCLRLWGSVRCPQICPFSRLNQPRSFSPSSQGKCSSPTSPSSLHYDHVFAVLGPQNWMHYLDLVWGVPHGVGQSLRLAYGPCLFYTAQEAVGCLCCQGTPWPHIQLKPNTTLRPFPQNYSPDLCPQPAPLQGHFPPWGSTWHLHWLTFMSFLSAHCCRILPQDMLCWMMVDCYCEEAYRNVIIHIRVPRPSLPINSKRKCLWINIRSIHNVVKLFAIIVLL